MKNKKHYFVVSLPEIDWLSNVQLDAFFVFLFLKSIL